MERAQVTLVDITTAFFVLVAVIALAPFFYKFIDMVSGEVDPFSGLILQLVVPVLFIGLIISVGVSARRRI